MGQADKHQGNPQVMADYTPGAAVSGGDVVVSNDAVMIAERDIAANEFGALAMGGAVYKCVADAAIAIFTRVYWDDTNNKVSEDSTLGKFFGITLEASSADADVIAVYHLPTGPENSIVSEEVTFTEAGDTTYTGSVNVPAGATILDVIVHAESLWDDGTSALMDVGDAADPNGFFAAVDLKATDLLAGESISFGYTGGKEGADVDGGEVAGDHVRRRYLSTARVVSGVVTTGGQDGSAGVTRMTVIYSVPSRVKAAVGA